MQISKGLEWNFEEQKILLLEVTFSKIKNA